MSDKKSEIYNKILKLVYSSKRTMPAHFCADEIRDRTETFCIDSELLDAESDRAMAASAWGMSSGVGEVVMAGENIMLASFFATKLGSFDQMDLLAREILDNAREDLKDKPEAAPLFEATSAKAYFASCIEYGRKTAL